MLSAAPRSSTKVQPLPLPSPRAAYPSPPGAILCLERGAAALWNTAKPAASREEQFTDHQFKFNQ